VQYFTPDPWFRLALSAARLTLEAQMLVGVRLLRIATGGVAALPEMGRMVPEKVDALFEAQRITFFSVAGGQPERAPAKVVRMYRRRVEANRKRLGKPTGIEPRRTS
jgi:hypothetical protein